jgi:hypothetical protein
LRGIAQTRLSAFCVAWAAPREPYNVPAMPAANPRPLPDDARTFSRSCVPITGNCESAEFNSVAWRCGSPCSAKPRIVTSNSSSGNSDKNP